MCIDECYDVIGDIHGCWDAFRCLTTKLGYDESYHHPARRSLAFVGDLINRGPDSASVLRTVSWLVREGRGYLAMGNHDDAFLQYLRGGQIAAGETGLQRTVADLERRPDWQSLRADALDLYARASLYLVLDHGRLVVAHAGIEEDMIGKADAETRRFVLHGDAIGKSPEGKTLRRDWAADYRGSTFIVYGHTPQEQAVIRGNTVNIDNGAYRGGYLTALRWPERTLVSVASAFHYRA